MDPIELLDILGNENRRRILQLLSLRPFYFNEIAKRLDVGPKAVIDHLDMLERAGLVECYSETGRRKYFRLSSNLVLEVALSPHSFGVRTYGSNSYAPAAEEKAVDLADLQQQLAVLESRRLELRRLMIEVVREELIIKGRAAEDIMDFAQNDAEGEVLLALLSGPSEAEVLSTRLRVPTPMVEDCLQRLERRGVVKNSGSVWSL
ncbi:MAG: helix-turn-helix domain-containing protein [Methanosarcinales archaeon]|nr:helix-turn-helix domain-containing protein [Methanosarcinales archaeon]